MQRKGGTTRDTGEVSSTPRQRIILGCGVGLLIVLDQLTKFFVRQSFSLGESVRVLGDFFRLTYIHNPAGAFGIAFVHPAVYFIASAVIAILISISLYRHPILRSWSVWGLALVLGGAVGNLIDRVLLGEVVDFLDCEFFDITLRAFSFWFIHFPGYTMTRWPIFNVADSAVTVGIVLLILSTWLDPYKPRLPADAAPGERILDRRSGSGAESASGG